MSRDPRVAQPHGRRSLAVLTEELRTAREEVGRLRRGPIMHDQLSTAHVFLLRAMESYAAELTARGLPIPWRLRDELRLQRGISTPVPNQGGRRRSPEGRGWTNQP